MQETDQDRRAEVDERPPLPEVFLDLGELGDEADPEKILKEVREEGPRIEKLNEANNDNNEAYKKILEAKSYAFEDMFNQTVAEGSPPEKVAAEFVASSQPKTTPFTTRSADSYNYSTAKDVTPPRESQQTYTTRQTYGQAGWGGQTSSGYTNLAEAAEKARLERVRQSNIFTLKRHRRTFQGNIERKDIEKTAEAGDMLPAGQETFRVKSANIFQLVQSLEVQEKNDIPVEQRRAERVEYVHAVAGLEDQLKRQGPSKLSDVEIAELLRRKEKEKQRSIFDRVEDTWDRTWREK